MFLTAEKSFRLTRSVNVAASTPSADQMGPFYLYIQALKASAEMFFSLGGGREEAGWDAGGASLSHPTSAAFFFFLLQTVTIN